MMPRPDNMMLTSDPDPVIVPAGEDLGASAQFIPPGQPEHRYDANALKRAHTGSVVYLSRADLIRMSRGEVVEVAGSGRAKVRLVAGEDFPPYWKMQS